MTEARGTAATRNPGVYANVMRDLQMKDPLVRGSDTDMDIHAANKKFQSGRRELQALARG